MEPIAKFTGGKESVRAKLNQLVDGVNSLMGLVGDGFIQVQRTSKGTTLRLSIDQLLARIPKKVFSSTFRASLDADASGGGYSFSEVVLTDGLWSSPSDGRTGTAYPLVETTGLLPESGSVCIVDIIPILDANGDLAYYFIPPFVLPDGGVAKQVLAKASDATGHVHWDWPRWHEGT